LGENPAKEAEARTWLLLRFSRSICMHGA